MVLKMKIKGREVKIFSRQTSGNCLRKRNNSKTKNKVVCFMCLDDTEINIAETIAYRHGFNFTSTYYENDIASAWQHTYIFSKKNISNNDIENFINELKYNNLIY
jgi:hypothetical protein